MVRHFEAKSENKNIVYVKMLEITKKNKLPLNIRMISGVFEKGLNDSKVSKDYLDLYSILRFNCYKGIGAVINVYDLYRNKGHAPLEILSFGDEVIKYSLKELGILTELEFEEVEPEITFKKVKK